MSAFLRRLGFWLVRLSMAFERRGYEIDLPASYGSHWHDFRAAIACKYCGKTRDETDTQSVSKEGSE